MGRAPSSPADPLFAEPAGTYSSRDRARRVQEQPKRAQRDDEFSVDRDAFARDRARVLHSSAFRRLADKTQVLDPGADDFPRTRLTHSLEVAQIARELGHELGCAPDVVDTAGLAHDLGHPPFGHNGEAVLNALSAEIGGFEGNAQTLRILTRLEPKTLDGDGAPAGLNLTRAVLDATGKYPWSRGDANPKFGVYEDDLAAFAWVRDGVPDGRRCLEAQVMDWADDVAYSVHDVEDGVYAGSIRLDRLDTIERDEICALTVSLYLPDVTAMSLDRGLDAVFARLLELPALVDLRGFDRSHAALAAAKRATSELTGRFAGAAVAATRDQVGPGPLCRYAADLSVPPDVIAEVALLKALAVRYVMQSPAAEARRQAQRVLLDELVTTLAETGRAALAPALRQTWDGARDDAARLRVVIDQVAQLTDSGAVAMHRELTARHD